MNHTYVYVKYQLFADEFWFWIICFQRFEFFFANFCGIRHRYRYRSMEFQKCNVFFFAFNWMQWQKLKLFHSYLQIHSYAIMYESSKLIYCILSNGCLRESYGMSPVRYNCLFACSQCTLNVRQLVENLLWYFLGRPVYALWICVGNFLMCSTMYANIYKRNCGMSVWWTQDYNSRCRCSQWNFDTVDSW